MSEDGERAVDAARYLPDALAETFVTILANDNFYVGVVKLAPRLVILDDRFRPPHSSVPYPSRPPLG